MRRLLKLVLTAVGVLMLAAAAAFFLVDRRVVSENVSAQAATGAKQGARATYEANIAAINQGSVAGYLKTVPPAKRAETKRSLAAGMRRGTTVTLQSFKVQKVTATGVVAKVSQLQHTRSPAEKQSLEFTVEFVRQDGHWYIKRSVLVNAVKVR
ncbi:hypothetical protein [Lacticaseibacillus kribbianus]|uniref:hypothetical protein n=1 Tax=Lacticaseibacillus kribbianus TaxID=2926292 RepID=UPI001CD2CD5B|nr:hypothetical protein [Lacticaseibacillus kribbianus]